MNMPLVTVLLPCFNAMKFLPLALESIRNQTYSNLEIICIDDGSSDNTWDYIRQCSELDARIVPVKNDRNLKLIATLNKGVGLASGEFIARMDADDIAFPERIEKSIEVLLNHPDVDLVCPLCINIDEHGKVISKNIVRNRTKVGNFFASFFYTPVGHPEVMVKTEVLKKNPYSTSDDALHTEDYELWCRLLHNGYNIINIDTPLQYFRINSNSVSNTYTKVQDDNFVRIASLYFKNYTGFSLESENQAIFRNRISKQTTRKGFISALKHLKSFRIYFIQKENISEVHLLSEIYSIYLTHKMDILIQSIKKSKFEIKMLAFIRLIPFSISILKDKTCRNYLLSKIRL